jgi:hypothetical protein
VARYHLELGSIVRDWAAQGICKQGAFTAQEVLEHLVMVSGSNKRCLWRRESDMHPVKSLHSQELRH